MIRAERYNVSDTVVARDLGGEVVLMDLAGGVYFGLNEVGAKIWWAIEANHTIDEICKSLTEEFTVELAAAESDVREVLATLLERNLITEVDE